MKRAAALTLVVPALALGACGGGNDKPSKSDTAQANVCAARTDISKQVDTLKGLTLSTATTEQIKTSLNAIGKDLNTIKNAEADLSSDRRNEVEKATQAFVTQVSGVISTLGSTTSLNDAKAQLTTAFNQMADAYKQTFAKIDCSS